MVTLIHHQGLKILEGIQIQTPSPSIGLAYIGAYLKSKGINYHAIDGCGEALDQIRKYKKFDNIAVQGLSNEEILNRIPVNSTIIGFSCIFSQCWSLVEELARDVRVNFPTALLVAGGEHPTALPEDAFRDRLFDVVVYGEGEETFHELVSKVQSREDRK